MNDVVFVDTETTGLDPERHEVWDIAIIEEDGTEHEFHVRPERFHSADEGALRITKFYERVHAAGYVNDIVEDGYPKRTRTIKRPAFWTDRTRGSMAGEIAHLTANKYIVGAVPSFDACFIAGFLMREQIVPAWHYHLIDVETMGVGYLTAIDVEVKLPWSSEKISVALGVDPNAYDRHTALGDARWVKAQYEAIVNGPKISR